jgi:S-adenosylmethionine decarboxylase
MRQFVSMALFACQFFTYLHGEFNPLNPFDNVEQNKQDHSNDIAYEFVGFHLVSSYLNCDPSRLTDLDGLREAMKNAVFASGATILKQMDHVFPPNGFTMVMLLSESHASIHTYPEHDACFVDFFTCGRQCSSENFDRVLREYLRPQTANCNLLFRDRNMSEVYLNNHDKN